MRNDVKLIMNTLRECAVATQCSKCVVICEDNECLFTAAAKAIESLAAELEQVKRERDAAVEDLKGLCDICAHFKTCDGPWCGDCDSFDECKSPCRTCLAESNWQWRGVKEG